MAERASPAAISALLKLGRRCDLLTKARLTSADSERLRYPDKRIAIAKAALDQLPMLQAENKAGYAPVHGPCEGRQLMKEETR
jgi:hypothetical protein